MTVPATVPNYSLVEMQTMATAVAESGLFGLKTPAQALALMVIAQAEGRHPALAARDYDIINGKPAKKSEAMLRDFLEAGGKVEWHEITDQRCDATFSHPNGGKQRLAWDMARAQRAGLTSKQTWKNYPRQMLRSRLVSEAIRTVYPAATSGLYEPGEVADITPRKPEPPAETIMLPNKPVTEPFDTETGELQGDQESGASTAPASSPEPAGADAAAAMPGSYAAEKDEIDRLIGPALEGAVGVVIASSLSKTAPMSEATRAEAEEICDWTERLAFAASEDGTLALAALWRSAPTHVKRKLKDSLDSVLKPAALQADKVAMERAHAERQGSVSSGGAG